MNKTILSVFLVALFVGVACMTFATEAQYQPVGCRSVKAECCEPAEIPCFKAVTKKGCLGRERVDYVPCDCDCDGPIKCIKVGCNRYVKARICECEPAPVACPPIPCYKAVCVKGCFGRERIEYVPCCDCDCDGPIKCIKVGCNRYMKVRICTCCEPCAPCAAGE